MLSPEDKKYVAEFVVQKMRENQVSVPHPFVINKYVKEALYELNGHIGDFSGNMGSWLNPMISRLMESSNHDSIIEFLEEQSRAINQLLHLNTELHEEVLYLRGRFEGLASLYPVSPSPKKLKVVITGVHPDQELGIQAKLKNSRVEITFLHRDLDIELFARYDKIIVTKLPTDKVFHKMKARFGDKVELIERGGIQSVVSYVKGLSS